MLPAEPTEIDIEDLVIDALERLPAPFRERIGSVAIVVEDEATPEQLASVRAHGLYGLYQGVPRTAWSADGAPIPSKITIFRGPLVRANPTPERLAAAVDLLGDCDLVEGYARLLDHYADFLEVKDANSTETRLAERSMKRQVSTSANYISEYLFRLLTHHDLKEYSRYVVL